ncbi:DUF362 domain-containing protein [bacterium]|nr:DUF362 domain-containing protein [bacterium]
MKAPRKKCSEVYFTSVRTKFGTSLLDKLSRLLDKAGFGDLPLEKKYAAVKIHFGERGNLSFLRPNFARTVIDRIKAMGGKPFLTDCNTLYVGSRKDALEHLETAMLNGFVPEVTGCPVIIGDGLKGTDEVAVPIKGEILKEALIGRAVMDADAVITLNHFKGHEMMGMGGAIKNLGMGCGSRAGKKVMHCDSIVEVDREKCIGCGACARTCAHGAPVIKNKKCTVSEKVCVGCGRCIGVCPTDAIAPIWSDKAGLLDLKTAEYALAVVQGRPNFHINFVIDVSPFCDCHPENDAPIVPDVGIFASFDPVAVDQASADAVLAQTPIKDSCLGESKEKGRDHFGAVSPVTDWRKQLAHAEKIGIGTRNYKLIKVG